MSSVSFALSAPVAPLLFLQRSNSVPDYVGLVILILVAAGAAAALVATVLGFRRSAAFGTSVRWFASGALCLLLYHVQFAITMVVAIFGFSQNNLAPAFGLFSFFNLFVALGAVCLVMGFVRLTDGR